MVSASFVTQLNIRRSSGLELKVPRPKELHMSKTCKQGLPLRKVKASRHIEPPTSSGICPRGFLFLRER